MKKEKILVLVTAQKSSMKLIDWGYELAQGCEGELHVLHVHKGNNVFENEDSVRLLQDLLDYTDQMGGIIHLFSREDVAECIGAFAEEAGVTRIVMGRPPVRDGKVFYPDEYANILRELPEEVKLYIAPGQEVRKE